MVRGGKNRSGGSGVTLFAAVPVTLLVLYLIGLVLDSAHEPPPYALIVPLLGLAISGVAVFQTRRQRPEQVPAESGDLLVQYAYHDALTDLPNRLLLRDRLTLQLASIRRTHISVAMLMIDLDGFKQINDTYGHLAGDELLVQVAERIRVTCRETDTVARLGGDEFAVLQAIEEQGQAKILAGRIIKSLAEPFELSKGPVQIGCSIGITITQDPEVRLEELINEADVALYRSKKLGGNAETFFDRNFDHLAEAGQAFEAELRATVERGGLEVVYTRQFERSGNWVGVDATLVWTHPQRGQLDLRTMLAAIDDRRLSKALVDALLQGVRADGDRLAGLAVTINASAMLLSDHHLIEQLFTSEFVQAAQRSTFNLAFGSADFEHIGSRGLALLEQLSRHGFGLVIDCSESAPVILGGIARLRPGRVRINSQFVAAMEHSPPALAAVRGICDMAHAAGIELVADGVANPGQHKVVLDAGCHFVQGPMWGGRLSAASLHGAPHPIPSAA